MNYLIGVLLAVPTMVFVGRFKSGTRRWLNAAAIAAVASFYVLFAALAGDTALCLAEGVVTAGFMLVACSASRNTWVTVSALAAHGVFDIVHACAFASPAVPVWWGGFCWTFDLSAAAILALNTSRAVDTGIRYRS